MPDLQQAIETLKAHLPSAFGFRRKRRQALANALDAIAHELDSLRSQLDAKTHAAQDLDLFYLHFENRYRGSEQAIQEKLRPYLEDLQSLEPIKSSAAILDLGCGRGEWLTLLRDAGFARATGVDSNARMAETCRAKGLQLAHADIFQHLEATPPGTYDAITAFHVIEHFPFDRLLKLLQLAHRALKPGGLAILETPNPRNLVVGGNTFYFDPTHVRPVPCELLACAAEHAQFRVARTYQRNPYPDLLSAATILPPDAHLLRAALTCGLDYGVLLQK